MALGWVWWRAWTGLVAGDAAALCVAGVALGDIHLRFTWQAWRLATSALVSRGRGATWRHPPSFCVAGAALRALGWLWWRAWTGLVAGDTAALCLAGVALGDIHLRFTWQVWHLATSTFVLRGFQWQAYACSSCPSHPPGQMDSGGAVLQQSSKEQSKPRTERLRKEVHE